MPTFEELLAIKNKKHQILLDDGDYADQSEMSNNARLSAQNAFFRNTPLRDAEDDYQATLKFSQDRARERNPQPQIEAPSQQLGQPSVGAAANAQDQLNDNGDYFQRVFANAGGLDDDELAPVGGRAKAPAQKKLGWGSRLWSGLKGLGQLAMSPLIALGGSIGAGIKGRRVRSLQERQKDMDKRPPGEGASEEDRKAYSDGQAQLHEDIGESQRSLGNWRQAWTQRNVLNNFSRLFTGRNMKMAPERTHYFTGGQLGEAPERDDD